MSWVAAWFIHSAALDDGLVRNKLDGTCMLRPPSYRERLVSMTVVGLNQPCHYVPFGYLPVTAMRQSLPGKPGSLQDAPGTGSPAPARGPVSAGGRLQTLVNVVAQMVNQKTWPAIPMSSPASSPLMARPAGEIHMRRLQYDYKGKLTSVNLQPGNDNH